MKKSHRPFGQKRYSRTRLVSNLTGPAYRFTIICPKQGPKGPILSDSDVAALIDLLSGDFKGVSLFTNVSHPLIRGTYVTATGKLCRDEHDLLLVYSRFDELAIAYFEELQKHLQKHARQEKVLIECQPVKLL